LIDDPPENIEELIGGFSSEDMESYERLLKEYDKEMLHLALLVAAENAETNLFGYTRRVLDDWRMRRITTPEKARQEIMNKRGG
jgi:DnaD/phage-associated family protein